MRQRKIVLAVSLALGLAQPNAHAQFEAVLNLSDLDGQNGFVIQRVGDEDHTGYSNSSAGDVNGDGFDDLIIGAFYANKRKGAAYVVFGTDSGFPNLFNLANLNGSNGFALNGFSSNSKTGNSVSTAGDVNGDGIDDMIIGAKNAAPNGISYAGSSFVVFGTDKVQISPFDLSDINGFNGFTINGVNTNDSSGFDVAQAGDFNGDGLSDIIIGAPLGESLAGTSYVIFGSNSQFPNPFNLSELNGANGFGIKGVNEYDNSGYSVSSAGDVNGDGFSDVIIGALRAGTGGNIQNGSSYVVFGTDKGLPNPFNLSSLNGLNGFTINGEAERDRLGRSVSSAGDVNGDGIDDLIIGAERADPNGNIYAGSSYVIFGSVNGFPNPFNLSILNGVNGFTINGVAINDRSGRSVSSAGDVNGDGVADLVIGANYANGQNGGAYVVFGSSNGLPNPLNLSTLNGNNGFTIKGSIGFEYAGSSVSTAGDVNGDGVDDLIIGADGGTVGNGSSYVVYGDDGIFNNGFQSD